MSTGRDTADDEAQAKLRGSRGAGATNHALAGWISPRRAAVLAVLALVALSFALRRPGLDYLMPHHMHRDGLVVVRMAELFRGGGPPPEADRLYVAYPHLLPRLLALLPLPGPDVEDSHDVAHHLERASAPWLQARLVSVLLSLLAIPATYLIARRFLDRFASLFATALVATSLLHVHFSTLSQPHGTAGSFAVLAVLAAVHLRRDPSPARYVLAGVATAAAAGTLHTGLAVVPALVVAHLCRRKTSRRGSLVWFLVALAIVAAGVRALYPWYFAPRLVPAEALPGELPARINEQFPDPWDGNGFRTIALSLWSYDPVLGALVLLGSICLLARVRRLPEVLRTERGRDLLVVGAHALPYFLVIGIYFGTYERFLMSLLPAFACIAAWGVSRAIARASSGPPSPRRTAFVRTAACMLLLIPLALSADLARIRVAPDTLERAAAWLVPKVAADAERIVILPYYDLPLAHSDEALDENGKRPWTTIWVRYQVQQDQESLPDRRYTILLMPGGLPEARRELQSDPSHYFDAHRADYIVFVVHDDDIALALARQALHAISAPLLRISPLADDDGREHSLNFRHGSMSFADPFWHELLAARSLGPTIEIFRWKRQGEPRGG